MRARFSRREGFVVEGGGMGGIMGGLALEDLTSPGSSSQNELGDGFGTKQCNLLLQIGNAFPDRRKQLTKDIRIMLAHFCEKSLAWSDFLNDVPPWLHDSVLYDIRVVVIRPGETRKIALPPDLLVKLHGDFEIVMKTPKPLDEYRLEIPGTECNMSIQKFWNPTDQYREYFSHVGRKPSNYKLSSFLGIEDPIEVIPNPFYIGPHDPTKPTESSIDEIAAATHRDEPKPKGFLTSAPGGPISWRVQKPQPPPQKTAEPSPRMYPNPNTFVERLPLDNKADVKHWLETTFDISMLIGDGCKVYIRQKETKPTQEKPQSTQNGYLVHLPVFLANRFYCTPHNTETLRLLGLLKEASVLSTVPVDSLCFLSQLRCCKRDIAVHEKIRWRAGSGPKRIGFLQQGSVLVTVSYSEDIDTQDSECKSPPRAKDKEKHQDYMKTEATAESTTKVSYIVSAPSSFFGYSADDDSTCTILSLSARSEWSEFFAADVERVCPSVVRCARKQEKLRVSRHRQATKQPKDGAPPILQVPSRNLSPDHSGVLQSLVTEQEVPMAKSKALESLRGKSLPAILELSGHQGIVSLEEKFATVKDNSPEMKQFYEFITPGIVKSKPEVSEDKPVTLGWGQEYDPEFFGNYEESYRVMPSICSRVPPLVIKNNNIGKEAKVNFLYNVNLCLPRYVDGKRDCWLPKYLPLKPHNDYLREGKSKRKSSPRSPLHSASRFLEESTLLDLDPVLYSEANSRLGSVSDAGSEGKSAKLEQNRLINISKLNLNQNALKIRKGCSIKRELHPSQPDLKQEPTFETAREQGRKQLKQYGPLKSIEESFRVPQVQSTLASDRNSTASAIISERSPIGSGIFGSEHQKRSLLSPIRVQPLRRKLSKSQDLTDMHSYSINSDAYDSLSISRQEMSNRLMEIKRLNKSKLQDLPFLHAHTKANSRSRILLRGSKQKLPGKNQEKAAGGNTPLPRK